MQEPIPDLTLSRPASENYTQGRGGVQSSPKCTALEIRCLGPILIRGLWGIKIWSMCDHLKKIIMTLDPSVNGFRRFNIFPPKSRESRISVIDA